MGYKIMAIIDFKKQNSKRSDRGSEELEQPKPTSDWKDPATPHPGKKLPVHTSGTMYKQETGRYMSPGMSGATEGLGHGKQKTPNVGAWNRATVQRGQAVPGASRGVGQPTIDGFIQGNAQNAQRVAAIQALLYDLAMKNMLGSE